MPNAENAEDNFDWRSAYAAVGEIVLLYTALDFQLNHIIIQLMQLNPSVMLEGVVATLDTRQKLELLKARARLIDTVDIKNDLLRFAKTVEKVAGIRNLVCHTTLLANDSGTALEFHPTAASKVFKSISVIGEEMTFERTSLDQAKAIIPIAEDAIGHSDVLVENLKSMRTLAKQKTRSGITVEKTSRRTGRALTVTLSQGSHSFQESTSGVLTSSISSILWNISQQGKTDERHIESNGADRDACRLAETPKRLWRINL